MATLTALPDLANTFQFLKLVLDLEGYCACNESFDFRNKYVYQALAYKTTSPKQVIKELKEQIEDNRGNVVLSLGEELVSRIENIKL